MKNKNEKQVGDGLVSKGLMIKKSNRQQDLAPKHKKPQLIELNHELDKEVQGILDNRISNMIGKKLNLKYKKELFKAVVALNDFVSKNDPFCPRTSLKNFTKKHILRKSRIINWINQVGTLRNAYLNMRCAQYGKNISAYYDKSPKKAKRKQWKSPRRSK